VLLDIAQRSKSPDAILTLLGHASLTCAMVEAIARGSVVGDNPAYRDLATRVAEERARRCR
jgi:hypothetical protein